MLHVISTIIGFLFSAEVLKLILTFIMGGGLMTLIKTYFDSREVATNSKIANMKAPVEKDAIQITSFNTLVERLQEDNRVLREDRDYWKGNYEIVRAQVDKLSDELERQEESNHRLRMEVEDLKRQLDKVESNSPAARSRLSDTQDSIDYMP